MLNRLFRKHKQEPDTDNRYLKICEKVAREWNEKYPWTLFY